MQTGITRVPFGQLASGETVDQYTLTNANGMVAKILTLGGIVHEIHAPDRDGKFEDVVLGLDTVGDYRNKSPYFGALVGRYGNRIARGRFQLDGQTIQLVTNDGRNHLHGGEVGFDKVLWQASDDGRALTLTYRSRDGEQGYPGNLDATVVHELNDDNELVVRFHAVTDRATPVNLTQHSYFNLAGRGSILDHELTIESDVFVPIDDESIPLGCVIPVDGTPFDFRAPCPIGQRIDEPDEQLRNGKGYDHCFALIKQSKKAMTRAAHVREPVSGRVLELFTQEPGVQFYSGNFLDGSLTGKGRTWIHRGGFCLEPEHFPDSPNQPSFPNTILRPGEEYETESRFRFSVDTGA
ncbi:MAG: aldose epimerase family protein [Telluria sp.]